MSSRPAAPPDHDVPGGGPSVPPPLAAPTTSGRRPTPAEEARTIIAGTNAGTLATLSEGGDPWASFVTYGALPDGRPVLCVSQMAEHGRNLATDPRASLAVVAPTAGADPLASARVTLAGAVHRPQGGAEVAAARAAHLAAIPSAEVYVDFGDFALWVLDVERVRWVGGYGRMASAAPEAYAGAEADPVAGHGAGAVAHLNADHADALLAMARALAGFPDATEAECSAADRYGLDLYVTTPRGRAAARVSYASPLAAAGELRAATVALTRAARA